MKPYRDGGRFRLLRGREYFTREDGLNFGITETRDKEYDTVFGPVFCHAGQKYKVDDVGLRGAVTRLTCAREPDRHAFHEMLRDNQFLSFGGSIIFREFEKFIASWIRRIRPELSGEELRDLWVDAPHPKRKLRVRTRTELDLSGEQPKRVWIGNFGQIKYVCKPGEKLPPGKYLRATADLGPVAASQGGYLMDTVKAAFCNEFVFGGSSYQFVKEPERESLISAFQDVWEDKYDFSMRCFSDDSIIGIATPEGRYVANADISACDGSNYDPVFNMLKRMMLDGGLDPCDVEGVFEQCKAECVIESYTDRELKTKIRKVVLQPLFYTLYSGSVLTTSINNCANFGIYAAICAFLPPYEARSLAAMPDLISRAAESVGYIVKCARCEVLEDLQFLKCTPTRVGSEWDVFLNLGVLLRNLGSCKGDLPGSGDLGERARIYTSDVIRSYKHAGDHEITDALRTKMVNSSLSQPESRLTGQTIRRIPLSALARRYRVPEVVLEELASMITDSTLGEAIYSPLLDRIFELDYGYPSVQAVPEAPNRPVVQGVTPHLLGVPQPGSFTNNSGGI